MAKKTTKQRVDSAKRGVSKAVSKGGKINLSRASDYTVDQISRTSGHGQKNDARKEVLRRATGGRRKK